MRKGDIVVVDFGVPVGSEPAARRPAVIVTSDATLASPIGTMHVVPLTTNLRRNAPTDINLENSLVPGLERPSAAQAHLVSLVSRQRIVAETGTNVGAVALRQIREMLLDVLDL